VRRADEPRAPGSRALLVAILGLAAALRAGALLAERRLPLFLHHRLDAQMYDAAGRAIAGGDWLLGKEVFHSSPLYAYFVGLLYRLFGAGPYPVRVAQGILGVALVALLYGAARRLLGPRAAPWIGLGAALYGPFLFYETQLLADSLAAFLAALLVLLVLRAMEERPRPARAWLGVGVVWGLLTIVRGTALLFFLPLVGAVLASRGGVRPVLRSLGALVLGGTLVVLPVTLRNWRVAGEPVLVTDHGGLNFFVGNGPGANGTFRIPSEVPDAGNNPDQIRGFRAVAERESGRSLSAREVDAYWYGRTWRAIGAAPGAWLRLLVEKGWLFFSARELANTEDYTFWRTQNAVLALPLLQFGALAPFALLGTILLLRRTDPRGRFVGAFNVTSVVLAIAFFVLARYRLSAVPALLLAAGAGVRGLVTAWTERRGRGLLVYGASLGVAAVFVFWPKLPKPFDDEYFKLGYAYHVQGETAAAADAYQRALEINPQSLSARKNLAVLLEQVADRDHAAQEWRALLERARAARQSAYEEVARRHLDALASPPRAPSLRE
jgi:4-amino-4-deoxy-L-arabinose transferase-like glycosyltransferase